MLHPDKRCCFIINALLKFNPIWYKFSFSQNSSYSVSVYHTTEMIWKEQNRVSSFDAALLNLLSLIFFLN